MNVGSVLSSLIAPSWTKAAVLAGAACYALWNWYCPQVKINEPKEDGPKIKMREKIREGLNTLIAGLGTSLERVA